MALARKLRKELIRIVGKPHCKTEPAELALYGYDATPQAPLALPEAVVLPDCAEQVAAVVRLAAAARIPVVARGAGTNLTGGARAMAGGLVLSTQRMNRILAIDRDNLQAVVQPGVVTEALQDAVADGGLFYPPDPQSKETCTLGGNLAENAGGPRAVKYGVTRQYVLALEAVMADGQRLRFGARTIKSVAGYDMVSLLIGSEGTLGIITEATLRLLPLPAARATLLAAFDSIESAAAAVGAVLRAGVLPSALEFVDAETIRCIQAQQPVGLPAAAAAALVIEVDGREREVAAAADAVQAVVERSGAVELRRAADEDEAAQLWKARRAAGPALAHIAPHKFNEDIVVPIARLPEAVGGIHAIAENNRVSCACFGHAGDGNIHVNFLVQPDDADQARRVEAAVAQTFELVVSLQGSITGEHGVGTTKQPFLGRELAPGAMAAMRSVKRALDPHGILNPHKIFPDEAAAGPGAAEA